MRPNVLLICTDEQRGDALGGLPGSPVDTPYLEELRTRGVYFPHAYSACPVCVPARRTLMSGKTPAHHGVLMNYASPLNSVTLPEALKENGFQTHLSGKLHLFPLRKLYGFCSSDWADGPYHRVPESDYNRFLMEHGFFEDAGLGHGISYNGWPARPFHMDERYHFTNWCTDCALRFFARRDPTVPFFLNVSYHQPHAPCTPPACYFQKYMDMPLPPSPVGDWADSFPNSQTGSPVNAWRVDGNSPRLRQYKAGYYGCIEHIDHQIGRILQHMPANTIVVFCSDHGEMLGDHGWIRKRSPYEGSARIPFLIRLPEDLAKSKGISQRLEVSDAAVELMDVMPTILDLLDIPIPDGVDGVSLVPAMRGEKLNRAYIHGECARIETIGSGMQYLTDGKEKYIWYPALGKEQLFDLQADPQECYNLAGRQEYAGSVAKWRNRLVHELEGRPERFTDAGTLLTLDGPTDFCIAASGEPLDESANEGLLPKQF